MYRRNKYGNKPVVVDGIRYDSTGEAKRFAFLQIMERAGELKDLRYHVKYELVPAIVEDVVVHLKTKDKIKKQVVQKARYYEADFVYTVTSTGEEIVEDFKGQATELFLFKAALFRYMYGKSITLVKKPNEWRF